jgi:hypothetical protein
MSDGVAVRKAYWWVASRAFEAAIGSGIFEVGCCFGNVVVGSFSF